MRCQNGTGYIQFNDPAIQERFEIFLRAFTDPEAAFSAFISSDSFEQVYGAPLETRDELKDRFLGAYSVPGFSPEQQDSIVQSLAFKVAEAYTAIDNLEGEELRLVMQRYMPGNKFSNNQRGSFIFTFAIQAFNSIANKAEAEGNTVRAENIRAVTSRENFIKFMPYVRARLSEMGIYVSEVTSLNQIEGAEEYLARQGENADIEDDLDMGANQGHHEKNQYNDMARFHENYKSSASHRVRSLLGQIIDIVALPIPTTPSNAVEKGSQGAPQPSELYYPARVDQIHKFISYATGLVNKASPANPVVIDLDRFDKFSIANTRLVMDRFAGDPRVVILVTEKNKKKAYVTHATRTNHLGLPQYASLDALYEKMSRLFADQYPSVAKAFEMMEVVGKRDMMVEMVRRKLLAQPPHIQNEFFTTMSKHHTQMTVFVWGRGEGGKYQFKVLDSDQSNVTKSVIDAWSEDQKMLPIVKFDENGNRSFDLDQLREIGEDFQKKVEAAKKKELGLKDPGFIDDAHQFLQSIGFPLSMAQVELLVEDDTVARAAIGTTWTLGMDFSLSATPGKRRGGNVFSNVVFDGFFLNTEKGQKEAPFFTNNPLQDEGGVKGKSATQGVVKKLAKFVGESSDILHPSSFSNVEKKTIYGYQNPTQISKRISGITTDYDTHVLPYVTVAFGSGSRLAESLRTGENDVRSRMTLKYVDGSRESTDTDGGKRMGDMSLGEKLLYTLGLFQQQALTKNATFVDKTKSDKTGAIPEITLPQWVFEHNIQDGKVLKIDPDAINYMAELITGEAKRIVMVQALTEERKALYPPAFVEGGKMFLMDNRFLNRDSLEAWAEEGIIDPALVNELWIEGTTTLKDPTTPAFQAALKSIIDTHVRQNVEVLRNALTEEGILGAKGEIVMSQDYLNALKVRGKENELENALLDYTLGYQLFYREAAILWSGDPAYSWKKDHDTSEDNFQKRAARDVAPYKQAPFPAGEMIRIATMVDPVGPAKNAAEYAETLGYDAYSENNATDAQEYISTEEAIWERFNYGEITFDDWHAIQKKIDKSRKDGTYYFELTDHEKALVIGKTTKPVYTGDVHIDGLNTVIPFYRKSSALPLIPEFTKGRPIDALRVSMERGTAQGPIRRVAFLTADKLGAIKPKPFETIGDIIFDESEVMSIPRDGWGIQQDLPEKDYQVRIISQMNKSLFSGVRDYDGFIFNGESVSGRELEDRKRVIMSRLYELGRQRIEKKFDFKKVDGENTISWKSLVRELQREARERGWSTSEIEGIKLSADGNGMVIPPGFSPAYARIEALILSFVTKEIVRQKIPGKGYVQISSWGLEGGSVTGTSTSYRPEIGLQGPRYGYIVDSVTYDYDQVTAEQRATAERVVQPAQIFVPFFFKDANGVPLDVNNFLGPDGKIDHNKLPREILRTIGGRIPSQGHSSMMPVEIVGFIPATMGASAVVPDMITTQMGSDFDIDKLYTYLSEYFYDEGSQSLKQSSAAIPSLEYIIERANATVNDPTVTLEEKKKAEGRLDKATTRLKKYTKEDNMLKEEFFKIHWAVLTHPDVLPRILKPLDTPDLKILSKEIGKIKPTPYISTDSPVRQMKDATRQKMGTDLISEWALNSQLLAIFERTPQSLQKTVKVEGEKMTVPDSLDVMVNGVKLSLTTLGGTQNPDSLRTKDDNTQMFVSGAVDNSKDNTLGRLGSSQLTTPLHAVLLMMQTDAGDHLGVEFAGYLTRTDAIERYQINFDRAVSPIGGFQAEPKKGALAEVKKFYKEEINRLTFQAKSAEVKVSTKPVSQEELMASVGGKLTEVENAELMLRVVSLVENLEDIAKSVTAIRKGVLFAYRNGAGSTTISTIEQHKASINTVEKAPRFAERGVSALFHKDGVRTEEQAAIVEALQFGRELTGVIFPFDSQVFKDMQDSLAATLGRPLREAETKRLWRGMVQYANATGNSRLIGDATEDRKRLIFGAYEIVGKIPNISQSIAYRIRYGTQGVIFSTTAEMVARDGVYNLGTVGPYNLTQSEEVSVADLGGKDAVLSLLGNPDMNTISSALQSFLGGNRKLFASAISPVDDPMGLPLGLRVRTAQNTEWGDKNYLIRRMRVRNPKVQGGATIVTYPSRKEGNLQENLAVSHLVAMLTSDDIEQVRLAEDLIRYSVLMGGVQSPTSMIKYVPIEYLEYMGHTESLRNVSFDPEQDEEGSVNSDNFFAQFVRHNPRATQFVPPSRMDVGVLKGVQMMSSLDQIDKSENFSASDRRYFIRRNQLTGDPFYSPYVHTVVGETTHLFRAVEIGDVWAYVEVPLLGIDSNHSEYNPSVTNPESISPDNLLKERKGVSTAPKREDNMTHEELKDAIFGPGEDANKLLDRALSRMSSPLLRSATPVLRALLKLHPTNEGVPLALEILPKDSEFAANGRYTPAKHLIQIPLRGNVEENIAHEVAHAVTIGQWHRIMKAVKEGTASATDLQTFNELTSVHRALLSAVRVKVGEANYTLLHNRIVRDRNPVATQDEWLVYLTQNVEEMISGAFSNVGFQKFAAQVKVGKESLYQRFVKAISRMLKNITDALNITGVTVSSADALGRTLIYAAKMSGMSVFETRDSYQYFGGKYNIVFDENGEPTAVVHAADGKAVVDNHEKILAAYMANPDVDPQAPDKKWRNNEEDTPTETEPDIVAPAPAASAALLASLAKFDLDTAPGGIRLNDDQKEAAQNLRAFMRDDEQKTFFLSGRAGTGKTAMLLPLLQSPEFRNLNIVGAGATHSIKDRLQDKAALTRSETLASLLKHSRNPDGSFSYKGGKRPIGEAKIDVLIIDEASMIKDSVVKEILDNVKPGTKIIFVGDRAQATPVGQSTVSSAFSGPGFVLSTVVRQKGNSPLANIANALGDFAEARKRGKLSSEQRESVTDPNGSVVFTDDVNKALMAAANLFRQGLGKIDYLKLITYRNESPTGPQTSVYSLNRRIRQLIWGDNASIAFNRGEIVTVTETVRGAERKILLNASTDLAVVESGPAIPFDLATISPQAAANIDGGIIDTFEVTLEDAKGNTHVLTVPHPSSLHKLVAFRKDEALTSAQREQVDSTLSQIDYGYAITSHKSQGATYAHVFAFEDDFNNMPKENDIEKPNLIYVAASRASTSLHMVNTQAVMKEQLFETTIEEDAGVAPQSEAISAGLAAIMAKAMAARTDTTNDIVMSEEVGVDPAAEQSLEGTVSEFMQTLTPVEREAFRMLRNEGRIQTKCK